MDSANNQSPNQYGFIPGARLTLQVDPARVVGCRGCDGLGQVPGGDDENGSVSFDVFRPCELCSGSGEQHCEADGCENAVTRTITAGEERAFCCDHVDCTFELMHDVLKRASQRALSKQQLLRRKIVACANR